MDIESYIQTLRTRLQECQATNQEIASAAGRVVSESWVSKFRAGHIVNPQVASLQALQEALTVCAANQGVCSVPKTKTEAIALFGTTQQDLAIGVGVTRGRISQWPEILTRKQADSVRGAAMRLGFLKFVTPGAERVEAADHGETAG
jgi:transcriptional regulator with XRE-family HTH domain